MSKKPQINIVYAPQTDSPHKIFENEKGEIWNSSQRANDKMNIGMGWYSIRDPKPNDSLFVVEPFCVLERDYDIKFAKKFKYVFTWANKAFQANILKDKVVEINHPSFHSFPSAADASKNWKSWDERKKEIVFVANNKTSKHHSELYSLRVQLADMLSAVSDYKISWYGQIPLKRPYFKGKLENKDILNSVQFSICTENCYDHIYSNNYFSEKMPDVWRAGAVPLYMGCYNIDSFSFSKDAYIDLRKFVKKDGKRFIIDEQALLQTMHDFDSQAYQDYSSKLKTIIDSDAFRNQVLFKKAYEKIIDTFSET